MLLVVLAGPNLISRDLRFNALPLYFSRPLTRLDYFLGKLGVIAALVAARGRRAGGCRLRAGRLLQSRLERDPRHVALAAGQHPLWPGDRRLGRHAHAGPVVAVAAVALRRHRVGRSVDHQFDGRQRAERHPGERPSATRSGRKRWPRPIRKRTPPRALRSRPRRRRTGVGKWHAPTKRG